MIEICYNDSRGMYMSGNSIIEELENARKKVVRKYFLGFLICLLFNVFIFLCFSADFYLSFLSINIFVSLSFIVFFPRGAEKKFKKLYKEKIVLGCFQESFDDVFYDAKIGISENTIASTGMMRTGDVFRSSDYLKAKYKNIPFECSDVDIEDISRDSDGDTTYTTIFKGQWYIFKFNKSFKSNFEVCSKCFGANRRGGLFGIDGFQKIELEDVDFHKRFRVYAKDELDVFYVLTPHMIERIKKLDSSISGELLFCFCGDYLHVGLYNNKDLYEHSVFSEIKLEESRKKVLSELDLIIQFVETLQLDDTLFQNVK